MFNPHPWNVKTNEWPGTFPSRRAPFAIDNCENIQLLNLTVITLLTGQAEGLLINCILENIAPEGWGTVGGDTKNMHYWEYNSTNISDGKAVDVSNRKAFSKQLTRKNDKEVIENYSKPALVLNGWEPKVLK